jgi:small redox-active disulfide protein 2
MLPVNLNPGEEVKSVMEIKVLGPGCKNCKLVEDTVRKVAAGLGIQAEVKKIEDLGDIAAHGVFITPGLIINGQVKAAGKVPKENEIKKWLEEVR